MTRLLRRALAEDAAFCGRVLWRKASDLGPLDFPQSVNVIVVTFRALVAVSLNDFFDEAKNKLAKDAKRWAVRVHQPQESMPTAAMVDP